MGYKCNVGLYYALYLIPLTTLHGAHWLKIIFFLLTGASVKKCDGLENLLFQG